MTDEETTAMVDAARQVGNLFADAFDRPFVDFFVGAIVADEVVSTRLRRLNIFSQPGTPDDLRNLFAEAENITGRCHEIATSFARNVEQWSSLGDFSEGDLYTIARRKLDQNRTSQELPPVDATVTAIRDEVFLLVLDTVNNPTQRKSIGELIRERFASRAVMERVAASVEFAALVNLQQELVFTTNVIQAFGLILGLSRGMLYRAVIEGQGSQLERHFRTDKLKEKGAAAILEAFSKLTLIGDLIGPAILIADYFVNCCNAEALLEQAQRDMASKYLAARKYIEAYHVAITLWLAWASRLQDSQLALLKLRREAFSVGGPDAN